MLKPSQRLIVLLLPEKNLLKGFYYIWACQPSLSCDSDAANQLLFPCPWRLPIKFDCLVVSEEKTFEECGRETDDGRTGDRRMTEPAYTISSPMHLNAQVS